MKNLAKLWIFSLALAFAFTACKDDANDLTGKLSKPELATEPYTKGRDMEVMWYEVKGAYAYQIEVIKTETEELAYTTSTGETIILISGLDYGEEYQLKLKARSSNPNYDSDWTVTKFVVGQRNIPTVLKEVLPTDILGNRVVLSWNIQYTPTRIEFQQQVIVPDGEFPDADLTMDSDGLYWRYADTYLITEDLWEVGSVEILGLPTNSTIAATLYDDNQDEQERQYNTVRFETGGTVLPGTVLIPAGMFDEYVFNPDVYGELLYLARGGNYTSSGGTFSKSVYIYSDELVPAELVVNGSFEVSGTVEELTFKDMKITQEATTSWFMDIKAPSEESPVKIGTLTLDGITFNVKGGSGVIRLDTTPTRIDKWITTNCFFDGSNYNAQPYLINKAGAGSSDPDLVAVGYMELSNSTVINLYTGFLKNEGKVVGSGVYHAVVKNNTFYNLSRYNNSNNYLFRGYGNGGDVDDPTVVASNNLHTYTQFQLKGIINFANYTSENNWKTGDWIENGNYISGANAHKLDQIAGSAADVFKDPENGDFTIILDEIRERGIGDPRWW